MCVMGADGSQGGRKGGRSCCLLHGYEDWCGRGGGGDGEVGWGGVWIPLYYSGFLLLPVMWKVQPKDLPAAAYKFNHSFCFLQVIVFRPGLPACSVASTLVAICPLARG